MKAKPSPIPDIMKSASIAAGKKNTILLSVCSSIALIAAQIPLKNRKMMAITISNPADKVTTP
jgi:hypothetical protein